MTPPKQLGDPIYEYRITVDGIPLPFPFPIQSAERFGSEVLTSGQRFLTINRRPEETSNNALQVMLSDTLTLHNVLPFVRFLSIPCGMMVHVGGFSPLLLSWEPSWSQGSTPLIRQNYPTDYSSKPPSNTRSLKSGEPWYTVADPYVIGKPGVGVSVGLPSKQLHLFFYSEIKLELVR